MDTYKYINGDHNKLTKYCNKSDFGDNGFTDNLTTLQASDDAATAKWGGGWHTPSETQWKELLDNTTHKWTTLNGKVGRLFTSKNGQSLFLPAAGGRLVGDVGDELYYDGFSGFYWSRSLGPVTPLGAFHLYFGSTDCGVDYDYRFHGFTVRPVREGAATYKEHETQTEAEKNAPKNGHEYVDLGLPSGTLWATCNVGADNPEGYGNYYAWGETTTKKTYEWANYKYANGDENKLTKYCTDSENGNNGFTDNLTILQVGDDPATANWGGGWYTPDKEQWEELLNCTTSQWTTQNGVKGYLCISKKNGQSIFLPTAGYHWDSRLYHAGSFGDYWSRSLNSGSSSGAWGLGFNWGGGCFMSIYSRFIGFTVRPVRENN